MAVSIRGVVPLQGKLMTSSSGNQEESETLHSSRRSSQTLQDERRTEEEKTPSRSRRDRRRKNTAESCNTSLSDTKSKSQSLIPLRLLDDLNSDVTRGKWDGPCDLTGASPITSYDSEMGSRVFMECKGGFTAMHRDHVKMGPGDEQQQHEFASSHDKVPVMFSIYLQMLWEKFYTCCIGLLAGISLLQFILVCHLWNEEDRSSTASAMIIGPLPSISIIILALYTICVIGILDRYDLGGVRGRSNPFSFGFFLSVLLIIMYFVGFASALTLFHRNGQLFFIQGGSFVDKNDIWFILSVLYCSIPVLGWCLVACQPLGDDFLKLLRTLLP